MLRPGCSIAVWPIPTRSLSLLRQRRRLQRHWPCVVTRLPCRAIVAVAVVSAAENSNCTVYFWVAAFESIEELMRCSGLPKQNVSTRSVVSESVVAPIALSSCYFVLFIVESPRCRKIFWEKWFIECIFVRSSPLVREHSMFCLSYLGSHGGARTKSKSASSSWWRHRDTSKAARVRYFSISNSVPCGLSHRSKLCSWVVMRSQTR